MFRGNGKRGDWLPDQLVPWLLLMASQWPSCRPDFRPGRALPLLFDARHWNDFDIALVVHAEIVLVDVVDNDIDLCPVGRNVLYYCPWVHPAD